MSSQFLYRALDEANFSREKRRMDNVQYLLSDELSSYFSISERKDLRLPDSPLPVVSNSFRSCTDYIISRVGPHILVALIARNVQIKTCGAIYNEYDDNYGSFVLIYAARRFVHLTPPYSKNITKRLHMETLWPYSMPYTRRGGYACGAAVVAISTLTTPFHWKKRGSPLARYWADVEWENFANGLTRPQLVAVTGNFNHARGDKGLERLVYTFRLLWRNG
ncbi:uncharacterized protein ARMOST_09604 [Armillaria ostoyae]|uniref:Uncharacterized protein n=1 Tax=Armillaria ostoyae TaxID=47428 RepID=A0A284RBY9_ARMOS|nr:uncharacterized protein ARMOST_09604 [Armillaria ostoyae]